MFEVIGERINTSRKKVQEAVANRDAQYIIDDVKQQEAAGATFIDVNAGARIGHETEDMKWLLDTIQPVCQVPLTLDSPDPAILEMAFAMVEKTPMINSISLEKERFDAMMPFLKGKNCKVIALCMDDAGMPESADDILARAKTLVAELNVIGIPTASIYVDPLVQPVSVDGRFGLEFINSIEKIRETWPGIHTACGLSNISYGLPGRKFLNRAFMIQAIAKGLDGAIINPLDKGMMASILLGEVLAGQQQFGIDPSVTQWVAEEIAEIQHAGVQAAVDTADDQIDWCFLEQFGDGQLDAIGRAEPRLAWDQCERHRAGLVRERDDRRHVRRRPLREVDGGPHADGPVGPRGRARRRRALPRQRRGTWRGLAWSFREDTRHRIR